MADPPKEDQPQKRPDIRYDDIVSNVVSDPSKGSQATLIAGYVGRGAEGRVRIYPDLSFGTYHDVAEEDIVHSVPIPDAPHGGSYVWVKSGAATTAGGAPGAQAAYPPYTVYPQITCGFVCHTQQDCPGGAAFAAQAQPVGPTAYLTCPPHICTETMVPTFHGTTCPRNICTETIAPTRQYTCPAHICTETIVPTRQATCPPHICTETMPPTRHFTCVLTCDPHVCVVTQAQANAAAMPPHTYQETCVQQPTGHPGICATQLCFGAGAGAAAMPTPTTTFNPTLCTRCFICPPITAPQTRVGVFCPYGG